MPFSKNIYAVRRARLAGLIGDESIAVIPTGHEALRNGDVHYPFRPSSNFWYLTGFREPDAVLAITGGANSRSILFCKEKDPAKETWTGFRFGPEAAQKEFGFNEAYPLSAFEPKLRELARGMRSCYSIGAMNTWDQQIVAAYGKAISGSANSHEGKDLSPLLDSMRLIKDAAEIEVMRKAAKITSAAHQKIMQMCTPGMMEYELEAAINYEFRRHGGDPLHAYPTIVAGGNNACTLHYTANDQPLRNGTLVLIDAGCEYDFYASDVTCTFPVNGKFSPEQRALYEIVLASQLAAIEAVRPGALFHDPDMAARVVIVHGLLMLGIMNGDPKEIIAKDLDRIYMPHLASHFLGHDVHDVGKRMVNGKSRMLEAGMVLTTEPGIYIPEGMPGVDPMWQGIGIRIEDDVLVTEDGHEVLTIAPKTVHEIESLAHQ